MFDHDLGKTLFAQCYLIICRTYCFFLKKWANPGLFFVYFRSFQTNNTILTTNQCENDMSIQYTAPGFEPKTSRM